MDYLIENNPDVFDLDLQENVKLYNEDEIDQFIEAKENPDLAIAIKQAVNFEKWDTAEIIQAFQKDITESFSQINTLVSKSEKEYTNQIIFIEHDYAKATQYKTYLLLFDAFKNLGLSVFKQIPIELPLFIYGNEHDCEAINIFIFENV